MDSNVSPQKKSWLGKVLIVASAVLWLALVASTWAEAAQAAEGDEAASAPQSDDEYNFNWLDPEKKIYVLQNRRYSKANRLLFSIMGGPGLSNPYRQTWNIDPRVAFYFTEAWGIEFFYTMTANNNNDTYRALTDATPIALPLVREIRSQYGGLIHWAPWYAKINVFNKILYFDWYFSGGAGRVHSQLDTRTRAADSPAFVNQDFFAFFLGTGHQFHLSQDFTIRLDFTSAIYKALVFGDEGESSWYSNNNFNVGIGYRL